MTARSSKTSPTVYSSATTKQTRHNPRTLVKWLHFINCLITFILFVSSFERLEWLADKPLIDLHQYIPYYVLKWSILIDEYSQILVYIGLTLHLLAMKLSTVSLLTLF